MIGAVDDLVIEALFVSYLQPSQTPTADLIEAAVTQTLLRLGSGSKMLRKPIAYDRMKGIQRH